MLAQHQQTNHPTDKAIPFCKASTICVDCMLATAIACAWIGKGDRTDLHYVSHQTSTGNELVKVLYCPRFTPGELPKLGTL